MKGGNALGERKFLRSSSFLCYQKFHVEVRIIFEFLFICNVDAHANISAIFNLSIMPCCLMFKIPHSHKGSVDTHAKYLLDS